MQLSPLHISRLVASWDEPLCVRHNQFAEIGDVRTFCCRGKARREGHEFIRVARALPQLLYPVRVGTGDLARPAERNSADASGRSNSGFALKPTKHAALLPAEKLTNACSTVEEWSFSDCVKTRFRANRWNKILYNPAP